LQIVGAGEDAIGGGIHYPLPTTLCLGTTAMSARIVTFTQSAVNPHVFFVIELLITASNYRHRGKAKGD
jgi:hypothetical protein